ncbi:hypothetical protein NYQ31_15210 [Curtobacterium flaccumfaciens]|uniref:hypothetical protein n=1 Tax=Curtobacterium flaccumfaciens TaxID=2035 RepID=UPI00217D723F|nr:hypothetical protein [Curtobacterium flaccumfaciens]MCS6559744.1 hypothetical protein [Curtobacterium flaccumfaciens]
MIVVNLKKSYREVLSGIRDMDDATLGWWAGVTDEAAERYGDVILGVFKERVVSAFDANGFDRDAEGRVHFSGNESEEFASLVGKASPARPWVRGQARPIQYIDTDVVRNGAAPVEKLEGGRHLRAVVAGYVLTVDHEGIATVEPPQGGIVTVTAPSDRVIDLQL